MARVLNVIGLVVGLFALVAEFVLSMESLLAAGRSIPGAVVRYFSFFTILTNILVVMVHSAALIGRPRFFTRATVRGGVTVSIIVVAVVYWTLLAGLERLAGLAAFNNFLLHAVAPVIMVAWWLYAGADGSLTRRKVAWWLLYPIAYLVYVFLRAPIAGEVPYPFLDINAEGLWQVLETSAGIAILFIAVGIILVAFDRGVGRLRDRRTREALR